MLPAHSSQLIALCIDTISAVAGITIVTPDLIQYTPLNPQMASEGIIETIDQTLKKAGIETEDLKAVLVIKGPGSFTGLRVGISVANQFSHQLKIPILGLKTNEWWQLRSEEKDKIYLQSMNREEVYLEDGKEQKIIELEKLAELDPKKWLGELKFYHHEKIPFSFEEIEQLNSIEETWKKALKEHEPELQTQKKYDLVEPFYGKEPKITERKK